MAKKFLQQVLASHFVKFSLIPILVVEVALLVLYFSINAYISSKNTNLLLREAQSHAKDILSNEVKLIEDKLNEVSMMAKLLQNEHQVIFNNPKYTALPNGEPSFDVAENGVFYKTNKVGSSVYYSAQTKIDEKARAKATFTEAMDTSFKSITEINPIIVATYFNSWDNMNRLYPFIDKVYEQYGPHIQMEDYNFYYLADLEHNPKKEPVWTGAYLDPAGNGWMLSCIVPIYNGDFLEGVTGLDITIDSFVKNILNTKLAYNAKLFMINKDGMIIAMPEKIEDLLGLKELKKHLYTDNILKTIEKPEEFNILKNKSPFASHFKNLIENNLESDSLKIKENDYLTLQQTVSATDWKLMVLIDKKEIFSSIESLKELSNQIGYLAIGFLFLFYIIFFYMLLKRINKFSQVITEPIIKLSDQTSEIKSTDSKVELIKTDIREIEQLNQNFSSMMNELNDSTRKLFEAKELAEELSRAKDDFLANMSHELKTPLNSINVISELMKNNNTGNLDEKQIKSLGIINKCGKDLLYLINDVLDISKLEAGHIQLDYTTLDIKELMENINDMFSSQAEEKGIKLNLEMDKSLNFIHSDEARIKQIVKNLLSNSLKFTPKDKNIFFKVEDEGKFIKISVEDEGIGIPEDKLEHIFDRFKQVDASTTRQYGGTGLGLAICKDLLKLLDGDIKVSSEIGKGSRFEVFIPKNEDKIDELFKKNFELKKLSKSKVLKDMILVYNNDPISFMHHIMEIKKHFDTSFTTILDEVIQKYKKETSKVLIEEKNLTQNDIDKIINNIKKEDLIVISEDKEKSKFKNFANKVIKKSFNIEELY
ncbi:sensor histidine kinase [Halarcobacter sp.]|uniref:sensor histidine kinase n=1 Tax=Halarcobacter sp. TaxID=2321133 RepID=UPI0029F468A3|nr:sensor histidine kinase [Halarcobacter sp.]